MSMGKVWLEGNMAEGGQRSRRVSNAHHGTLDSSARQWGVPGGCKQLRGVASKTEPLDTGSRVKDGAEGSNQRAGTQKDDGDNTVPGRKDGGWREGGRPQTYEEAEWTGCEV